MENTRIKDKTTILIVDDERVILESLAFIFVHRGYIVEQAENGKECLEKVAHNKPDIILIDIKMPVMDGFEACRRLKENPATRDISIILSSATYSEEIVKTNTMADDFIAKPFLLSELILKIDKLLNEKRK